MVKQVCVTGATGVMGSETVKQLSTLEDLKIKIFVVDSEKDRKIATSLVSKYGSDKIDVCYGDLRNYDDVSKFIQNADYVLHIGGLVSPVADDKPVLTYAVNVDGAENIVKAIHENKLEDTVKVVYIGSVAETGDRNYPIHWGRTGDPIQVSVYDHYGVSKVLAERVFAESGIKHWAVFRQSGILYPGLLNNMKPIMFHVPLNGVLEWCTVEDSGRLMKNFVDFNLPDEFWNRFYNIGSGEFYRLTNFEFEDLLLRTCGLGSPKDLFQPNWFATQNFHGHYYADSDVLENYLKFRENLPTEEYFERMCNNAPLEFRVMKSAKVVKNVAFLAKPFMKMIACDKDFGTLGWVKNNDKTRLDSFYGGKESFEKLPDNWSEYAIKHYDTHVSASEKCKLDHGYDETKPFESLTVEDLKKAAEFRGGELVSTTVGKMTDKLVWKCGHCGKEFEASPNLILRGGHWCPHCFIPKNAWDYGRIAENNKFFAQVWYPHHSHEEKNYYDFNEIFDKECFDTHSKKTKKSVVAVSSSNQYIYLTTIFVILFLVLTIFTLIRGSYSIF